MVIYELINQVKTHDNYEYLPVYTRQIHENKNDLPLKILIATKESAATKMK